jgi:hypothetical protein
MDGWENPRGTSRSRADIMSTEPEPSPDSRPRIRRLGLIIATVGILGTAGGILWRGIEHQRMAARQSQDT